MSRTEKRRRMALLYIRTAREVLEEEEHDGPHPLEDAIDSLKNAGGIVERATQDPVPESFRRK